MKAALKFLKDNNVKCVFLKNTQGGMVAVKRSTMYVGTKGLTKSEILSIIFHEYAHVWGYRNNKYLKYYTMKENSKGYKQYMRRIALKAERYTDKMGAVFMKQVYPKRKFKPFYDAPHMKDLLMKYYNCEREK